MVTREAIRLAGAEQRLKEFGITLPAPPWCKASPPHDQAAQAKARILSGEAELRVVLTMSH